MRLHRYNRNGLLNVLLFLIYTFIYGILIVYFDMGNAVSNWRYYILVFISMFSFFTLLLKFKFQSIKEKIYGKELLYMIIPAILFLIFSWIKCDIAGVNLQFRTLVQISLFLLPALYAFCLINIFSMKHIISLFKIATLITIMMYFLEPKHFVTEFFKLSNWLSISINNSNSFTESHNFFDTFFQLFMFFFYYMSNIDDNKEKHSLKKYCIITFIFSLMCFKRLGILFLILTLLFKKIILKKKKSNYSIFVTVLIVIITILYTKTLQGQIFNFSYDTLFKFSSGRNWFLQLWSTMNYQSYGYGSSMFFIGRFLEMDLVEIYLELNFLCLFVFVYMFLKMAKKDRYASYIVLYVLLNMLTSSSLPWTYGWIIMFSTVGCITSNKIE